MAEHTDGPHSTVAQTDQAALDETRRMLRDMAAAIRVIFGVTVAKEPGDLLRQEARPEVRIPVGQPEPPRTDEVPPPLQVPAPLPQPRAPQGFVPDTNAEFVPPASLTPSLPDIARDPAEVVPLPVVPPPLAVPVTTTGVEATSAPATHLEEASAPQPAGHDGVPPLAPLPERAIPVERRSMAMLQEIAFLDD